MRDFQPLTGGRQLVSKPEMRFGLADRLSLFSGRYRFFTPALLYLYGHFTDRHLLDFLIDVNREVPIMLKTFNKPIFSGLEDRAGHTGWNRTLWAVAENDWADLENFILSVAIYDHKRSRVYRSGSQSLSVFDPLWQDNHAIISAQTPVLDIVSFGVDCNAGVVALDTLVSPPGAVRFPPQPRTQAFAALVLKDEPQAAQAELDGPLPLLPVKPILPRMRSYDDMSVSKQEEINAAILKYREYVKGVWT